MILLLYFFGHCTTALRISKITKCRILIKILLNFDRSHLKLFGTSEKLPKDLGNFFVKYFSKMWYLWTKNMNGMTEKIEILHRAQLDPALQKTSKQLFLSRSIHGENISQIFSFTKITEPHNIKILPEDNHILYCIPKKTRLHEPTHLFINYIRYIVYICGIVYSIYINSSIPWPAIGPCT